MRDRASTRAGAVIRKAGKRLRQSVDALLLFAKLFSIELFLERLHETMPVAKESLMRLCWLAGVIIIGDSNDRAEKRRGTDLANLTPIRHRAFSVGKVSHQMSCKNKIFRKRCGIWGGRGPSGKKRLPAQSRDRPFHAHATRLTARVRAARIVGAIEARACGAAQKRGSPWA